MKPLVRRTTTYRFASQTISAVLRKASESDVVKMLDGDCGPVPLTLSLEFDAARGEHAVFLKHTSYRLRGEG